MAAPTSTGGGVPKEPGRAVNLPLKAPKLTIAVEPLESGKAVYLPLAAAKAGTAGHAMIVLRLRITNNEAATVQVSGITYSFPGSGVPAVAMKGVALVLDPEGSTTPSQAGGKIGAGVSAIWSNGRVDLDPGDGEDWADNMVYLSGAAPPEVRVEVTCQGYAVPAMVTLDLAPWSPAKPTGALLLPFAAGDLRNGEYVVTRSWHWANGGAGGTQIMAHDIGVQAVSGGAWTELLSNKPSSKNDSYRIWSLPIRAMADGEVESWEAGMADNTVLGKLPNPTPSPVAGNHFWIKHGDVYALYAHFQQGSQPAELLTKGARVNAGQFLGRVGNTGNSTNPHTHIQLVKGSTSGALRGLPFRDAWVIDRDAHTPPKPSDPWVKLDGHGIPKKTAAIWPASTTPGFKIPAVGIARGASWANSFWISTSRSAFEATAQQLFDDHGRRLVWVSSFVENGKRRFAGIARQADWANAFWVSTSRAAFEAKAQKLFDEQGKRLVHVHTYQDGGTRHWMGIARSGNWSSSFWISDSRAAFEAKAQELFDGAGRRLTFVHTYPAGSQRRWIGIAQGGSWANSFWVSEGFSAFAQKAQQLFDDHGRRLVHVHTYVSGGKRYWAGISRAGDWANSLWFSADLDMFRRTAQDLFEDQGRRLAAVEFLDA